MTTNTQPVNQAQLNDAQTDEAKKAMDGIKPTDINQDKLPNQQQVTTDESLLDMMNDAKKPE